MDLPKPPLDIKGREWRNLVDSLAGQEVVALLGSGISDWKPAGLPTGQAMTGALATLLSEGVDSSDLIAGLVRKTAFEHVMEACPRHDVLGRWLRLRYSPTTTNAVHKAIATLVRSGRIRHVVTTNYDACLETALNNASVACQVVVTEDDDRRLGPSLSLPVVFKVHGCALTDAVAAEPTMVFSLRREGVLKPWKRDLLARLAAGRIVLVCGYSGMDFEICPQLELLDCSIVWNSYELNSEKPVENARRVLRARAGDLVVGDMKELLGDLLGTTPVAADRDTLVEADLKTAQLLEEIRRLFSSRELLLWQARLFSGIGCADALVSIGERLLSTSTTPEERIDALWALGRGRFHQGKYLQAARHYRDAAQQAQKSRLRHRQLSLLLDESEANRCAGRYFRSWHGTWSVGRTTTGSDGYLRPRAALGSVLVWRHLYQFVEVVTKYLPVEIAVTKTRAVARRLLKEAATGAAEYGEWLDYQQCELWASRLRIPIDDICEPTLRPLPSQQGYLQLGYLIARSMAIRDSIRQGLAVNTTEALLLCTTFGGLGANAELWKLARVLGDSVQAKAAFGTCEYTILHRRLIWSHT